MARTGTSLARAVLNGSSQIGIAAGESHFLDARFTAGPIGYHERFASIGALHSDEGLARVVDHIYGLSENSFWTGLARRVDRADFERQLRASERSDRALFDLAMANVAAGKPIRGEKTPQHLQAVPTLLEWFPESRVIQTLRDPRAVHVSLRRKEGQWVNASQRHSRAGRLVRRLGPISNVYEMTKLIVHFRQAVRLHRRFQETYGDRYHLLQFERLVLDPDACVRELCGFAGVEFEPAMLDQVVRNSSFVPRGSSGFDRSAVDRWRQHMTPLSRLWFALGCGREMTGFGYR